MTIANGTERITAALEELANEHGVIAVRECPLFGGRHQHATDVCWHDERGECLIRFEVDSKREQAEYNLSKPFYPDMDAQSIPAHFIFVRFHHAARGLRPVLHLAAGLPLPPAFIRPVVVDHRSSSLLADLRQHVRSIVQVVGPGGRDVDDVYLILKPYQLLMCEGRLDLAINALDKKIRLLKKQRGKPEQLSLHAITLARLLQQAGWLTKAEQYVKLAHTLGSDAVPATARDLLASIEWKLRLAAHGADWRRRADLLKEAEHCVGSLRAPFIWRQALAQRRLGRASMAHQQLKRYQDNGSAGTESYKQSVSNFFAAQERYLARDWDAAVLQGSSLADLEMQMLDNAGEQPTASLSAIIAAEVLRAMILSSAAGEVSVYALQLLRELLAQGLEFGISVNAESLSDIALQWPRELVGRSLTEECRLPRRIWLKKQSLEDQIKRLRVIHGKLDELASRRS